MVFKTIALEPNGFHLVDLSPKQKQRERQYMTALTVAANSMVANPFYSKYFCREGMAGTKLTAAAGNIEYGFCQALHGEESAVAAWRAIVGQGNPEPITLGIFSPEFNATRPSNPCGNCRDIMRDEFGNTDLEIVRGRPDGEVAVVVPLSHYLFDNYVPLMQRGELSNAPKAHGELRRAQTILWETLCGGRAIENDAYSPRDVHPRRRYYACVVTETAQYMGAHTVMADYHPSYALYDAIRAALRENDTALSTIYVVGCGDGTLPPDVMYKDRQHLLEFNLQTELVTGKEIDPPVYLGTMAEGIVTGIWRTSVKEWLPFPFTARNFMDLGKMTAYFKRGL